MLKLTALCSKVICGRFKTGRFKTVRDENHNCFRRMNKSERLCHICNSGDIEDELILYVCVVNMKYIEPYYLARLWQPIMNSKIYVIMKSLYI